jgi:hypothetical protein
MNLAAPSFSSPCLYDRKAAKSIILNSVPAFVGSRIQ